MPIDLKKIDPDLAYPLKEVAQLLDISYGTVLKLRKEAKLGTTRIGRKFYVTGKELLEYIQSGALPRISESSPAGRQLTLGLETVVRTGTGSKGGRQGRNT